MVSIDSNPRLCAILLHRQAGSEGEPAVLLHDFPVTSYAWRKIIPALIEQFTVTAPDLRGCGDPDQPESSYDRRTVAEGVHQVVQKLGFKSINLVSHDVGMMVGLCLRLHLSRREYADNA